MLSTWPLSLIVLAFLFSNFFGVLNVGSTKEMIILHRDF